MSHEEASELLVAVDTALDDAEFNGHIRFNRCDPQDRELSIKLRAMGAPLFVLPTLPHPPMTAMLVMDTATFARMLAALWMFGATLERGRCYGGVPIKVDENADGRIYIVSLHPMSEVA